VYPPVTPCHDAFVLPYAAYLRVYEPLCAFPGPEARRWAMYAASPDRPRWAGALAAEQADALRRLVSVPQVMAPEWESGDAYVRRADGVTYICPWQTRLRSWLRLPRLRVTAPRLCPAATAAAAPTRTLVYATAMAQARGRLRRALAAFRRAGAPLTAAILADDAGPRVVNELRQIESWLAEFHPDALVELDYGGLVHLLDDKALRADQSVAEVSAAINALTSGELEMATAMYWRVTGRWRALAALGQAS